MAKWRYQMIPALNPRGQKVRRDKDGLYVDWGDVRLHPDIEWEVGYEFGWANSLARDPESRLWMEEAELLNRLGEQGWEIVTTHVVDRGHQRPNGALFIYVLKQSSEQAPPTPPQ